MGFLRKFKKEAKDIPKCKKCGKREASGEDGLCDHCRIMEMLDKMAKPSKS